MPISFRRSAVLTVNSYPARVGTDGEVHVTGIPLGLRVDQCREGVDFVVDSALRIQSRPAM